MQLGPLTRRLAAGQKFLSHAPRVRDASLSPSPTVDGVNGCGFDARRFGVGEMSATCAAGTIIIA